MSQQGHTTSTGNPITGTTLKLLVHRVRNKEQGSLWWEQQKPNWEIFSPPEEPEEHKTTPNNACLVCGTDMHPSNKSLCSADCVAFYHQHKHTPHDPKFSTIFHQVEYEDQFHAERH